MLEVELLALSAPNTSCLLLVALGVARSSPVGPKFARILPLLAKNWKPAELSIA